MNDMRKMLRTRWVPGSALFLTVLALAACGGRGLDEAMEEGQNDEEHDVVQLDSTAIAIANITLVSVETVETTSLPVTGTITYDANRVSHVGSRIEGRIVRLSADIGANVTNGQTLAILESPEIGQLRADEQEAVALVEIARENFERERRLEAQGISSRKELLDAEADLRRAEAALNGTRQKLNVLGAGEGEGGRHPLTAPFRGVVVARHASLGEMASPSDQLFTVADLDRLWIELDIYERDLSRVRSGQKVEVTTAAYPGRDFPGEIAYVGDILDPERRTIRVRVEIPNIDRVLRPGMFATANIQVDRAGVPMAVIPEEALQEVEGRTVVFVPGDRAGEFRAWPIEVGGRADGGRIIVLSGLEAGDLVVGTGAFALRSELARNEIGEAGHGH